MIKRYVFTLIIISLISSCKTVGHQLGKNKRASKVQKSNTAKAKSTQDRSTSTLDYIEKYHHIAIKNMKSSGIPASITLAQGILESGSGNSILAKKANNHFGIKCGSKWQGPTYKKHDDAKNECFRKYREAASSFQDHSEFLKKPRYAGLYKLDIMDYKAWAHELKRAGYATNPVYATRLIQLIERYNLTQYDAMAMGKSNIRKKV